MLKGLPREQADAQWPCCGQPHGDSDLCRIGLTFRMEPTRMMEVGRSKKPSWTA
jgi:hypothetical protein